MGAHGRATGPLVASRPIGTARLDATFRRLSLPVWLLGLAAIAALAGVMMVHWPASSADRVQQLHLVQALSQGHLSQAMGGSPDQTSPPGYGLYALPIYLVAHIWRSPQQANDVAGWLTLPLLALAGLAASRAAGIPARSARELGGLAALVAGVPTLAALAEAYHPCDILATSACLAAYAAVVRRRLVWASLFLGLALETRQWAIIVIAVVVVLHRGRERRVLALAPLAVFAVLTLPFAATGPRLTFNALSAPVTVTQPYSLPGLVSGQPMLLTLLSRFVPLLLVALLCLWLASRRACFDASIGVAALAVALLTRPLVDPASFLYYLGPGYAFFILIGTRSWRWVVGGALAGVLLYRRIRIAGFHPARIGTQLQLPGVLLSLGSTMLILAGGIAALVRLHALVTGATHAYADQADGDEGDQASALASTGPAPASQPSSAAAGSSTSSPDR